MLSMKLCFVLFCLILLSFVLSIQHSAHWVRLIFAPPPVSTDSRRAVTLEDPCLHTICVSGPGAPCSPSRDRCPQQPRGRVRLTYEIFSLRGARMFISHSHLTRLWAEGLSLWRHPNLSKSSACQFQRWPPGSFQCKGIGIYATQTQPQKSRWQQFGKWLQMYCRTSKSTYLWRKCWIFILQDTQFSLFNNLAARHGGKWASYSWEINLSAAEWI